MGIQNPGPQKFLEVKLRALSRFIAFIACVSLYLELHSTNITLSTDLFKYYGPNHIENNKLPDVLIIFQEKQCIVG